MMCKLWEDASARTLKKGKETQAKKNNKKQMKRNASKKKRGKFLNVKNIFVKKPRKIEKLKK